MAGSLAKLLVLLCLFLRYLAVWKLGGNGLPPGELHGTTEHYVSVTHHVPHLGLVMGWEEVGSV